MKLHEPLPRTPDFVQSRWNATVDIDGAAGSITTGAPHGEPPEYLGTSAAQKIGQLWLD